MLEEVDVEVDGAVEDGEEVREVGDPLHPRGPFQVGLLVLNMNLQEEAAIIIWHNEKFLLQRVVSVVRWLHVCSDHASRGCVYQMALSHAIIARSTLPRRDFDFGHNVRIISYMLKLLV